MVDVMPNWKLEQERLKMKILSIEATVERQQIEIAEMHERAETHIAGMGSSKELLSG